MNNFLKGKRTYISIAIIVVGFFGGASLVSDAEVTQLIDSLFQILGILGAVYGRYNA